MHVSLVEIFILANIWNCSLNEMKYRNLQDTICPIFTVVDTPTS